ncbi:glycosyl transferase [Gordonibacter sp. An230]|uniref:transglycosylase domain-containing protein n=1 Tax=Gordonibacter sp. An230 TaxID=1965592 RepID=UPI000B3AD33D|nr:transglycosylase domain-containing protein [Gordonibacter sp. An230]OUO87124.1 glycosyl transferase [Gordonibacter sp. An230]
MKIRRKQREKRTHGPKWALLIAGAALCFITYWGAQGALRIMEGWTEGLPSIEDVDFTDYSKKSVMYANDESTVLAEFRLEKREPLESAEQISPYVLKGTVDTEDVRFYEHDGVDLLGIARAFVNNLTGGALEGASTITQQLVRNTVLADEANDISLERKIREAELAVDMEKRFSKDEILLMYLNTINYGDGCYGIEAAARNYFQVSAADLTLAQAATLVGIPQSPTYLNPKEYPDACLERRNTVLDRMLSAGDITQEEHDAARAEELNLNPAPATPEDGIYAYPYFSSYVQQLLSNDPAKYGLTESSLFEGGYTIYTSLDPAMQEEAEAACAEQNARMVGMGPNLESALVAMEPETGLIKAMVGGRDYYESQWNIATQGGQPTGSTFKVFTLAAAIEQGISPDTRIDCSSPMDRPGAEPLENFGGADYGIQTIKDATALSSNTGYYRLTEQVTPAAMNEMATRLGVGGEFVPNNTPTAVLGTENCTPLSMATAYSTLATGGVKHDPVAITKIVDQDGDVVYEAANTSARVLTEEVSGAVTKVLRSVFESSNGTAYGSGPANGQPVAGKTGTVQEFRGHWLVGYAPQLSCAVWLGNRDYEQTDPNLTANQLWQDFMSRALAGSEIEQFPETKDPEYKNEFNEKQAEKYGSSKKEDGENGQNEGSDPSKAPDMAGKTLDDAIAQLSGYNAYMIEEYSDSVPAGTIIGQKVEGDKLILIVSKGRNPGPTIGSEPGSP